MNRRKLEDKLQLNNILDVWSGMMIIDFKQKEDQIDGSLDRASELNSFLQQVQLGDELCIVLTVH